MNPDHPSALQPAPQLAPCIVNPDEVSSSTAPGQLQGGSSGGDGYSQKFFGISLGLLRFCSIFFAWDFVVGCTEWLGFLLIFFGWWICWVLLFGFVSIAGLEVWVFFVGFAGALVWVCWGFVQVFLFGISLLDAQSHWVNWKWNWILYWYILYWYLKPVTLLLETGCTEFCQWFIIYLIMFCMKLFTLLGFLGCWAKGWCVG